MKISRLTSTGLIAVAATAYLLSITSPALAHRLGENYVFLDIYEDRVEGRVELLLTDVDKALDVDMNHDGKVDQAELDAALDRLHAYILPRLKIKSPAGNGDLRFTSHEVANIPIGRYIWLHFVVDELGTSPHIFSIHDSIFFDQDSGHRSLLMIANNEVTGQIDEPEVVSLIFNPGSEDQKLDITKRPSWFQQFMLFCKEGIWHIWIGIDHVLFLVALVLPSVLIRKGSSWNAAERFRPALWHVVKIVTLFTVAHSITLSLAAMDIVRLPPRIVESVIAASVLVAALNNFRPFFRDWTWGIIFAFGLFHGLGFASVFSELMTNQRSMLKAVVAFNIGVEIGQIGILIAVFPLLYAIRTQSLYRPAILQGGSALIALLAAIWCVERAFDIVILGI